MAGESVLHRRWQKVPHQPLLHRHELLEQEPEPEHSSPFCTQACTELTGLPWHVKLASKLKKWRRRMSTDVANTNPCLRVCGV
jgi:hypothetical protein